MSIAGRVAFFDPQRRAASPKLQDDIKLLTARLATAELTYCLRPKSRGPAGQRKFSAAVEAIVCNLLILRTLDPQRHLAVPRSNGMIFSGTAYGGETYGKHFLDALDVMTHPNVNLVEVIATGFRFAGGASRLTTIRGTDDFFDSFSDQSHLLDSHRRIAETDVLVLKGVKPVSGKSQVIRFAETKKTQAFRAEILKLNVCLSEAPIFLRTDDFASLNENYAEPVDPTKRTLRRIFSNGKWNEGGRLFGGFWETMRRTDRFELLRIRTRSQQQGEPVANVDYGQLFPRLAYMRARRPVPDGDLYDVFGGGIARAGVKKLLNAMLFARGSLKAWPKDTKKLFPPDIRLSEAVSAITKRHEAISSMFGTGIGYQLMFIESILLLDALAELRAKGIVGLPLHDSVLVGRSEAESAKAVLEDRLGAYLSGDEKAVVTIDFGEVSAKNSAHL